jgi:polyhydroxybutyrate depolymerase
MNRLGLLIILSVICSLNLFSQGNGTFQQFDLEVDGLTRQYKLYVPEGHDGTEAWPLVFNFHMANSNMNEQIDISEMYLVADTAMFLIVYPQGLPVLFRPYAEYGIVPGWNIPDLNVADQDDISFVREIVEDISDNPSYMIDQRRIHATGISSGGALSCFLAFNLSELIASVASVASPITDTLINYICSPVRQISVLHIQGTDDPALPAVGWPEFGIFPLMGVTDYWANVNGCNDLADSTQLEDIDQNDNSTVTLFDYNGCDQETEVKLYRINGGGHTWPGGWSPNSGLGSINKDINASSEIWSFFKRNPHPKTTLYNSEKLKTTLLDIYPNPTSGKLNITTSISEYFNIEISALNGQVLLGGELKGTTQQLDLSSFREGVYFITIRSKDFVTTRKIIKL